MKKLFIPVIVLLLSFGIALALYNSVFRFSSGKQMRWKHKDREIRSRLLAVPILLYHNIDGNGVFSVSLETLRSQFELLRKRNIRVIPLKELISRLENPVPFDEKVAVITFDDGFLSMYTKLLPLVREYGYPVTLFVYTDFIYAKADRSMTWELLREMDSSLIDIQCHSISHEDLTAIPAGEGDEFKKKIYDEVFLSKRIIELYLGKKVDYFAFPYGRYDINLVNLCEKAGYKRVFSTDYGSNIITRDNYCLRRQHIKRNYSLVYFDSIIQNVR